MTEELERIEDLEAHETARRLPLAFHLLFWGLIAWGIYYCVSYIPAFSGWSQEAEYRQSLDQ